MKYALLILVTFLCFESRGQIFNNRNNKTDSIAPAEDSVTIQRIFIIGNKKTKDQIILRELHFQEGDTVSLSRLNLYIERDRNRIYNLRLFNKVDIDTVKYTLDLPAYSNRTLAYTITYFEGERKNNH